MKTLFFSCFIRYNDYWKVCVKMKKIFIVLLIGIVFLSLGCGKKLTTYTQINYQDYVKKLDNGESFPLVIGSETCSACGLYQATMETFIEKNQIEVFFIDISKISEDEYKALKTQISFDGTPTTVFIEKGKLTSFYNRIDGAADLSYVINTFKNNNYIK